MKNSAISSYLTNWLCLTKIFGKKQSSFPTRYQCLQLIKKMNDEFVTYVILVNMKYEGLKMKTISKLPGYKCRNKNHK